MSNQVFIFIFFLSFISCSYFDKKEDNILVKVHGDELYFSDIKELISNELSQQDSADFVSLLVENWAKEQLLIHQAKLNLNDEQQDFSKLVDEYKNSLLIYAYKQQLLNQKMDTSVTDDEISAYYDINKKNFRAKNDIARLNYIKFSSDIQQVQRLKKIFISKDEDDLEELEEFCLQFSEEYHINDEWVSIKDLIKKLPDYGISMQSFRGRKFISYIDDNFNYFIFLKEYIVEGYVSPIDVEKNQIKTIILNRRKIDFIKQLEKDLYQTALAKDFVIYD